MGQGDSQWGPYHASASVMMALLKMPAAWFQLSLLYLAPSIHFRCASSLNQSYVLANMSEEAVWDNSCTYVDEDDVCRPCHHWQYDRHVFTNVVNMQWDLVCSRELLVLWAQVSFMCGVTTGNAVGGIIAGRVGRKPVLVMSVLLQPLLSAIVAVMPTFTLFLIFRFLLGLSLGGTMVISFILGGELLSGKWRPIISILHQVPFGMGQTIFAIAGFFLRDWRELQMALSVFSLIFLPYCWLIEESPQWLLAAGKLKRAEEVTATIRYRNGLPKATSSMEMQPKAEKNKIEIVNSDNNKINNDLSTRTKGVSFCDLFCTPRLRRYTLSIWIMWYCAGLGFFALNAYQPALGSNPFINIGVGGLVGGIPGNIMTVFLVRWFGRKKIVIIAHLFTSLCAILIPIYDVGESIEDWQRRLFGLLTLIGMSVGYPALFLMSGELLPPVIRSSVLGVAHLMARCGNTTAPLVVASAMFHRWTPLCIIAAAPMITVLLMIGLPETKDAPMPQSIQDFEKQIRRPEVLVRSAGEDNRIYKPVSKMES